MAGHRQAGHRSLGRGPAWLLLGLLALCPAAFACTAGPAKWVPATSGLYDSYSTGQVVVDWVTVDVNYLVDCAPLSTAYLSFRSNKRFVGFHDGQMTFATDHEGIGIQLQFRYIRSISSSGMPDLSDWQNAATAATAYTAHAEYIKGNPTASLPIGVRFRFVALRNFDGEDILMGDEEPLLVVDRTYGQSLNQLTMEGVRRRARVRASCEFSSAPPANVQLPRTTMADLSDLGDTGPAAGFSFSWRCRAGNEGHSGRGDLWFDSPARIKDQPGRLATTGDAEGVDMLVTLTREDGSETPIQFRQWYADILMPGARGLPSTGRQEMQVRFIRNANALKPGSAHSSLTITTVPY